MSRITQVSGPGTAPQFIESIGHDNHVLSTTYSAGNIQTWKEGENVWNDMPKFQDNTNDFNLIDTYDAGGEFYPIGVDYSRDLVFACGSTFNPVLVSASFDANANITPIASLPLHGCFGRIAVDEGRRFLFLTWADDLYCVGYDADGTNLTLLSTEPFPIGARDVVVDPIRKKVFVADTIPSQGIIAYSYDDFGVLTKVFNFNASNHGYTSLQIDVTNMKLFACHHYRNSPVGLESLSYDLAGTISLIDTKAPFSGTFGDAGHVVVDFTRTRVFMIYDDGAFNNRIATYTWDPSYILTPTAVNDLSPGVIPSTEGPASLDTTKKYLFMPSYSYRVPGTISYGYNETGTNFYFINKSEGTIHGNVAVPAYNFILGTTNDGIQSFTYVSVKSRDWGRGFCHFQNDLYTTAYGNLVKLEYTGSAWTTTKITDYKTTASYDFKTSFESITEYDGRIYATASGELYRTNATFDAWEFVAPRFPGPPYGIYNMYSLTEFNGRLYGVSSGRTFRLNLAGDAWELAIDANGMDSLKIHKGRLYGMREDWDGRLYVMNDTEDDWILLAGTGQTQSYLVADDHFLYTGSYASGYGSTGQIRYYLENQSVLRTVGLPITHTYPSPARYVHAPCFLNGKVYFCGGASLYRVDMTLCVTNVFLWDEDQHFYGWAGPGMGIYNTESSQNEENMYVDGAYPVRSSDGVTWNEITMTERVGPQWELPSWPSTYKRDNFAPITIWANYNGFLYSGANRLIESIGSYATISRTSNGTAWTEVFYHSSLRSTVRSMIVYHGNLYAAVEVVVTGVPSGHTISKIYRTSDGVTWDLIKTFDEGYGTFSVVDAFVEHNNDLYMELNGNVYVSNDGITWANTQGSIGGMVNATDKNGKVYFYGF